MTGRYKALAALQVADVAMTGVVLHLGGAEQNGAMKLLTDLGVPGLLAILAFKLWVVARLARRDAAVNLVGAVYGAVVLNNALFLGLYLTGTPTTLNPMALVAGLAIVLFAGLKLRAHAPGSRKVVPA